MNSSLAGKLGFIVLALAAMAGAADTPQALTVSPDVQPLHIYVGKSAVVNVKNPLTRILSSNPNVIDTLGVSPTQVVVEGKAAGVSSLMLWDDSGLSQIVDISVDLDLSNFRKALARAYPGQPIDVQADGTRLILSGNVSEPRLVEELGKMGGQYSAQVVNSITVVPHERQIMLEVKFAEVDRSRVDQLGFNFLSTGAGNTPGVISTQQFGPPSLASGSSSTGAVPGKVGLSVPDLLNVFLFRPDLNLGATVKALEQNNILQVLAEPNLMALNGQKASFLSGGEFPFPVVQGGQTLGAVTIQFRPFGVKLDFTATVDSSNVIRIHVAPEVSTLDFTNAITISGFVVPAISTRRAETEIQLKDGQSFGIAGLIDRRVQSQLSKVPGIGDVPILGQLFRSKNVNRSNGELLVLVTPHIVDPVRSDYPAPAAPNLAVPFLDTPKFDEKLPGHKDVVTPVKTPDGK